MGVPHAIDAIEVADYKAAESPFVAEQVGEQRTAARRRYAIERIIRGHHGKGSRIDGLLERRKEILFQVARTSDGRSTVLSALGRTVANEVLQRGQGAVGLGEVAATQSANHCGSQRACQHGILAKGFLHPTPSRFAGEVDDGSVADMSALQANLFGYHFSGTLYQLWRPSSRHSEACREDRCADGHVAVRRLFGQKQGNAQACILHHISLQGVAAHCCQLRVEAVAQRLLRPGVGTVGGPEHAYLSLGNVFLERFRRHHFKLGISPSSLPATRSSNLIIVPGQRTAQLANFLLEGHAADKVFQSLFHREFRVLIRQYILLFCRYGNARHQAEGSNDDKKFFHK